MFKNSKLMAAVLGVALASPVMGQMQMERLTRGVVAVNQGEGKVFVSWRLLGTEPDNIAFNVYRKSGNGQPVKLNAAPLMTATCYQDNGVNLAQANEWTVRAVVNGAEQPAGKAFSLAANAPVRQYIAIPLKQGTGTPNDASAADLDGDGDYEIIIKRENGARDNSQAGRTEPTLLEAYKQDGTLMWTVNLGVNIRGGAHYTQPMVYDFDGDGKAEMFVKTADGTVDGTGKVIGDATKDYRDQRGMILEGAEFLTVFSGMTGAAIDTIPFEPARGIHGHWGDTTGNRVDRFNGAVAYLDGQRPSAIMARGYYTGRDGTGRNEIAAYNLVNGKIQMVWHFKASRGPAGDANTAYMGQGNHGIGVADVDNDGKQEIIYGATVIDDNGNGLYSTGLGHGDAQHTSDMDPTRPGLEIFSIHENPRHQYGAELRDAATGKILHGRPGIEGQQAPDTGRGVAFDIDPRHLGYESWSAGGEGMRGVYNAKGEQIAPTNPSAVNFCIWWDGDLLREILDRNLIGKWNWETNQVLTLLQPEDCESNNGTKATPTLSADLFGDWREEVIWRATDNSEIRIYTTTIPTDTRLYTLMHDPQYRVAIAWQNSAYNQPPHPGFYLGHGMQPAPRPNIRLVP